MESEWVSLGEAAAILGIHPTTVRHWADSGDLPSQRTPGGHRRFRRYDLEQWANLRHNADRDLAPAEVQLMMQSALGRARMEVVDGHLEGLEWYSKMDEEARKAHRMLGRRLLEVLTRYLAAPENYQDTVKEVRIIAQEYVRLSQSHSVSLADSVRAFLFFRDLLADSVIQLAEMLSLRTPLDWGERIRQVNHITDELLLGMVEGYESSFAG